MDKNKICTHNRMVTFGKHKGERWTRLPISYLKWLINEKTQYSDIAKSELKRRGSVITYELKISGHAIDRVSFKYLNKWKETRKEKEGIHSWLYRMATEALEGNSKKEIIFYKNLKFVFSYGEIYPTLKTVL